MTLLRDFSCLFQNQSEVKHESLPLAHTVQKVSANHIHLGYQCNPSEVLPWDTFGECCSGWSLLHLWWLWPQRLLLELSRQAENSRTSDTWHFSSSPTPIREITVWNWNTREVLVSPLPECLECSRSLNTHQHNLRNPRPGGKHAGSSWAKGH